MGEAGLFEAIAEALQKGGVLREAGIVTIEAESPELSGSVVVFIVPQDEKIKLEVESIGAPSEAIQVNYLEIEEDNEQAKPQI